MAVEGSQPSSRAHAERAGSTTRRFRAPRRPRRIRRPLVWASVGCVLLLGLAEAGLRFWAHHHRVAFERYDTKSGTYRLVPGTYPTRGAGEIRINSAGLRGAELSEPTADLVRIVAVGDSCTFGSDHQSRTWPALLQDRLDRAPASRARYEVVNGGVAGADSRDVLRRFESVIAPLEPEVVVVYVGWNDLMKFSPRSQAGEGAFARWSRAVDRLWLVRALRKAAFFYVRGAVSDPDTGASSRTGRFADFVPGAFEANLERLIEAIRASGARPMLVTLATPLRPGMSASLVRSRGIFFPFFAGGDRVGDFRDLIEAYNDTIRRVGAEHDVAVADLAAAVEQLPDPTPWFWDTMHMNHQGQVLMSDFLLQSLGRSGLLAGPSVVSPADDGMDRG